jgi:prolyl-tRNA editing enzyme YbaK/EbsC (Cys-tRNA(Pro) deacylase)
MARPGLTAPGAARLLGFERTRVLKTPAAATDRRRLVVTLVPADLTAALGAAVAAIAR